MAMACCSSFGQYSQATFLATRIPGHVQPVGRPCGTWMHYAMRDVKDMGQQMGYLSLEWNWPKEAMNIPIRADCRWSQAVLTFYLIRE